MYRFDGYTVQSVLHELKDQRINAKRGEVVALVLSEDDPTRYLDTTVGIKYDDYFYGRLDLSRVPCIINIRTEDKHSGLLTLSICHSKESQRTVIYLRIVIEDTPKGDVPVLNVRNSPLPEE